MPEKLTPVIVGNWKMNGLRPALLEVERLAAMLASAAPPRCTVGICPPATLLAPMNRISAPAGIVLGGQDCHWDAAGPHTGDLSAPMLADCGAQMVIVGHSERRTDHGETDDMVNRKAHAALSAGLTPIVCVGESRAEREAGLAEQVVTRQLVASIPEEVRSHGAVVAYEPIWAIGTGLTPTAVDIARMHKAIREQLVGRFGAAGAAIRILYGGSLKPANAREILSLDDVNGGLVGGASLLADDFFAIISAA